MNDRFNIRYFNKNTKKFEYLKIGAVNFNLFTDWTVYEQGQFCTGLKDKNGKLIYEGDIVKFAFHEFAEEKAWEKAVIVWGDKYKYPAFDIDKCEFECNGLSYIFNEDWVIEVIGNIYENKELLESEG